MATEFQPFVGPRSFERDDRNLFFGRDRETKDLGYLVEAHDAVILYAQSGAGKTSLINASLIPLLEARGIEVLPGSASVKVGGMIPQGIEPEEIPNIYILNTIMSLAGKADPKDVLHLSLPDYLKERKHSTDEAGLALPRVIIFDQFEQIFTSYQERWRDREGFFRQVAEALKADPLLHMLFAVREDYLASLDPFTDVLSECLTTHYRIERLRREAAISAVKGPLKDSSRAFAKGAAEELIDRLLTSSVKRPGGEPIKPVGEFVEPVHLQVVCRRLWNRLGDDVTIITAELLEKCVDVDDALKEFYETAIKTTIEKTGIKEKALRTWFGSELITPAETRGLVYRDQDETGGIPNKAIDVLEREHIIKAEVRGGRRWYELTHDRLIQPITTSNQDWFGKLPEAGQALKRLEGKASEWVKLGKGRDHLLNDVDLREAERWLESPAGVDLGYSDALLDLVTASRVSAERRRLRKIIISAVIIVGVFVALGTAAILKWMQADTEAEKAAMARADADYARFLSELAKASATRKWEYAQMYSQEAEASALATWGLVTAYAGEYWGALEVIIRALELNPHQRIAYEGFAFVCNLQGQDFLAAVWYEQLRLTCQAMGDSTEAKRLANASGAISAIEDSVRHNPDGWSWVYPQWGRHCYEYLSEYDPDYYDSAYHYFDMAVKSNPQSLDYRAEFAEASLANGKFREAYTSAQAVLAGPDSISVQYELPMGFVIVASLVLDGHPAEARTELESLILKYNTGVYEYKPTWSYDGSRRVIESRKMEEKYRKALLKLIDILETPTQGVKVEDFRALGG